MTKAPFTEKGERASDLLALIHTDVCGPVNKLARGGYLYFITFTYDFSRYGYTVAHILNHAPSKLVEKTPYEMWHGRRPNMSFLKIWGCEAYVKKLSSDKLGPKSDKSYFVGYPKETRGYYFYNPTEGKVFVARTAVFLEKKMKMNPVFTRRLVGVQ
ncbi:hypothetical protein CRG98_014620 [Punica granatum]|uniref:Retroviral polymerase SH3-like domain-containing protein n=1 Tax=Punica granatum TaxID=22663 RepID=A0A2I0KB36_PUNGR|nr:hypothetical protein CRG98_014620 [Punica granatum]